MSLSAKEALREAKEMRALLEGHLKKEFEEDHLPLFREMVDRALLTESEDEDEMDESEDETTDDKVEEKKKKSSKKESDDMDDDDEEMNEEDDGEDDEEGDDEEMDESVRRLLKKLAESEEEEDDDEMDESEEEDDEEEEMDESVNRLIRKLAEEYEDDDDFYDDEDGMLADELDDDDADFLSVYESKRIERLTKENKQLRKSVQESELALNKLAALHNLVVKEGLKGSQYTKMLDIIEEVTSVKELKAITERAKTRMSESKKENKAKRLLGENTKGVSGKLNEDANSYKNSPDYIKMKRLLDSGRR